MKSLNGSSCKRQNTKLETLQYFTCLAAQMSPRQNWSPPFCWPAPAHHSHQNREAEINPNPPLEPELRRSNPSSFRCLSVLPNVPCVCSHAGLCCQPFGVLL